MDNFDLMTMYAWLKKAESVGMIANFREENRSIDKMNISGGFYNRYGNYVYMTKVIYRNPWTVVMWSDGTKTMVKAVGGDTYDEQVGLWLCYLKKLVGVTALKNLWADWFTEGAVSVDLKDVRAKQKAKEKAKALAQKKHEETQKAIDEAKKAKKSQKSEETPKTKVASAPVEKKISKKSSESAKNAPSKR